MSNEAAGGHQIADTGDYEDAVCPACLTVDGDGPWVPLEEIQPEKANPRPDVGEENNQPPALP